MARINCRTDELNDEPQWSQERRAAIRKARNLRYFAASGELGPFNQQEAAREFDDWCASYLITDADIAALVAEEGEYR